MSNEYANPLQCKIHASRWLAVAMHLLHLIAVIAVFITQFDYMIKAVLLLGVVVSWIYYRRISQQNIWLVWGDGQHCLYGESTDQLINARLTGQQILLPWLVILNLKTAQNKTIHLIITADRIEPLAFRRLKVRLRVTKSSIFNENQEIQ